MGRAEGKIDLHDISRELAYRARIERRFSWATTASASVGLVDSAPRKPGFAGDATDEAPARWRNKEFFCDLPHYYRSSMQHPLPGLVWKNRMQTKRKVEDSMDKAQKVW